MGIDAESAAINTGSVWAPYQEFTYTVPAGSYQRVNYVTDNFVLLETSANGALEVNFGGAMNQTNFTTGIQYRLTEAVPYVQLHNSSDSPLTVHFALGVGEVKDNRLSLVGQINTTSTYNNFATKRYVFPSSGVLEFSVAAEKIIIQNSGSENLYIGAANGFLVSPTGSMDLELNGTFSLYGTATNTVVVGALSALPVVLPDDNSTTLNGNTVVELAGGVKPMANDSVEAGGL